MSTIADYSVFTKAFLASNDVDFSKLSFPPFSQVNSNRAFAVVPLALEPTLTPREAMNFDWSKLGSDLMWNRVSCRDANGEFIGNIVRIQPGVREGSIRLVAKVAIPEASDGNVADASYNTFVLLRTDSVTSQDLPIAVATISAGYRLHKHLASGNDPLDDVENANYVSFTINHLNGYTSVDFNPDAYATYDVTDALSHRIDGLHIAFDTASGDLKLLDKDGNVLDQANLPIKTDVIIADGEEGYKYVKTDVKQDIHAAKAWMPEGSTAWEAVPRVDYTMRHAALVVDKASTPASREFVEEKVNRRHPISTESVSFDHVVIDDSTYMVADKNETEATCNLLKVKGKAEAPSVISSVALSVGQAGRQVTLTNGGQPHTITNEVVEADVIKGEDGVTTYVLVGHPITDNFQARTLDGGYTQLYQGRIEPSGGSSTGGVVGITLNGTDMYTFEGVENTITSSSNEPVKWFSTKAVPGDTSKKYGLEAFVWTVKDAEAGDKIIDPFFKQLNASLLALGFHEGDDIALGTNLANLSTDLNGVDADDYIHGKNNKARREQEVDTQRANAKEELVAWNAQHPALEANRGQGTIIDSSGLDVRNGRITLGCGRTVIEEGDESSDVNYGIRMNDRSDSLEFAVSRTTGAVQFDKNGHATNLTSSTLLSIEAGGYISGAPTCLILAQVSRHTNGNTEFYPVRMTTGFDCDYTYTELSGSSLLIHDYRENISAVLTHNIFGKVPAIIEVQAIYTHRDARNETVPAQQMHTYIGEWTTISDESGVVEDHPGCRFSCNKIEEWMAAIDLPLPDLSTGELIEADVQLYVVIRVY